MATSEVRSGASRLASSWRTLERMQTHQVPIALGGALAVLAGVVTYALAVIGRLALVPSAAAVFLVVFGALALLGYVVSKAHARNGALVAGVAGLALLFIVGDAAGVVLGLIVLVGAAWGVLRSL